MCGDSIVMPHRFLLIPMALASESILEFRESRSIGDKIKAGLVVVTMIRIADTAFYKTVASALNSANPNKPNLCHNCLRGQICQTSMKVLRGKANSNVIHKMEDDEGISFEDLEVVEGYYNEIFRLPLMDPIKFPEAKSLKLCQSCRKKWKT